MNQPFDGNELNQLSARDGVPAWPILRNAIFGSHDYVGPFFTRIAVTAKKQQTNDTCHGDTFHGALPPSDYFYKNHDGDVSGEARNLILQHCFSAVRRADLVFAWIYDHTCFGTLVELGYAKALGKNIVVATPKDGIAPLVGRAPLVGSATENEADDADYVPDSDECAGNREELWFALRIGQHVQASNPITALREILVPIPSVYRHSAWKRAPSRPDQLREAILSASIKAGPLVVLDCVRRIAGVSKVSEVPPSKYDVLFTALAALSPETAAT